MFDITRRKFCQNTNQLSAVCLGVFFLFVCLFFIFLCHVDLCLPLNDLTADP